MNWIEVSIITTSEAVEAITSFIHDMGANVSILDPNDLKDFKTELNWVILDDSLLVSDDTIIKVYFPEDVKIEDKVLYVKEKLKYISQFVDIGKGEVNICKIDEEDWANEWKKYYTTIKVSNRIVIKPTWEEYIKNDGEVVIELDPGMAFGTGTHETTRLCIKLLEKYVNSKSIVFDVGCGSGILSICSSKLGATKVVGCDLDPIAVSASNKNISLNKVSNIEIREGNFLDVFDDTADVIVSNIGADAIIFITSIVGKFLRKNGLFISSGIILDRTKEVKDTLQKNNFSIIEIQNEGEWVTIIARKDKYAKILY